MKKQDVNWIPKAPQRCCATCMHEHRRENACGDWIIKCGKHGWNTKAGGICDDYKSPLEGE